MKYSIGKRISYSLIVLVLLVGLILTAVFGMNGDGYGSVSNIKLGLDLAGGVSITYEIDEEDFSTQDVEDTIYKLQKRVEGKSTESQVYREGDNRIAVEIPGVTDANAILEELGTPGSLEFLDSDGYSAWMNGEEYTPLLTGNDVSAAQAYTSTDTSDSDSPYGVQLTFTDEGSTKFDAAAAANLNKVIYIVYDGEVVSSPVVKQSSFGGTASITEIGSYEEADTLATFIRVGSIPLTLKEVSSNIVGAQLGKDAIKTSLIAAAIGLALLCVFMIVMYRIQGVVATLSLSIYTTLVLFLISVYDLTLTLPGIAGIILGIGMAVDANVIIYTRIREDLGAGKSVENAIVSGYKKASSAIIDGNVTTLIAAVVLYIFGTGPVKGFATTLAVGNIVSIFTALVISKVISKLFYNFGFKNPKFYGKTVYTKTLDVLSIKKWAALGSTVVILAGFIVMAVQGLGLKNGMFNYSLEFIGGTTTSFTFEEDYSQQEIENEIIPVIRETLGISEVQQQKVQESTTVSFKTPTLTLEQREKMEEAVTEKFAIKEDSTVESETISASVSSTMKRDAILSVILATICMLIYIFVRFRDIKFALAAVIALVHDVLVVLAFYAFARVPVGTTFIACMLTIVGYSINGTIIIFDRIREQLRTANSKTNITELVNSSITSTLSRTVNTTITTLIMLIMLFILGVTSVKEFALPLIVGIVVGAYSSICLTSAMWYVMGGKKRGIIDEQQKKKKKEEKVIYENGAQV
ncbi:MAG: protein translocase subunit SecD [Lachnospira sp.]